MSINNSCYGTSQSLIKAIELYLTVYKTGGVSDENRLLEQAVTERRHVIFDYRNADGEKSRPCVEPLAIHYKWYAWYLFAYSPQKKQYRTYKVARMQNLQITDTVSAAKHNDVEMLMKDSEQEYYRTCIRIEVRFDK